MPQLISKTKGIRVPHALRPWLCSRFFFLRVYEEVRYKNLSSLFSLFLLT